MKEIEMCEWLLQHKEGLKDFLGNFYSPYKNIISTKLYREIYADNATKIVKSELQSSFNLSPEEACIINQNWLTYTLGEDFFEPN